MIGKDFYVKIFYNYIFNDYSESIVYGIKRDFNISEDDCNKIWLKDENEMNKIVFTNFNKKNKESEMWAYYPINLTINEWVAYINNVIKKYLKSSNDIKYEEHLIWYIGKELYGARVISKNDALKLAKLLCKHYDIWLYDYNSYNIFDYKLKDNRMKKED